VIPRGKINSEPSASMAAQPSPLTIRDKLMKIFLPRQAKIAALGADCKGTISIDERILAASSRA
jgi:hypothetical protein